MHGFAKIVWLIFLVNCSKQSDALSPPNTAIKHRSRWTSTNLSTYTGAKNLVDEDIRRSSLASRHQCFHQKTKRRPTTRLRQSKLPMTDEEVASFPDVFTKDLSRTGKFSTTMALCGALLGPFLDAYHSAFGVLQYDEPITLRLWGVDADHPALITAWWVPELFGLAGVLIGVLYVALDSILKTATDRTYPSAPKVLIGISIFTFQYYLSGILFSSDLFSRTDILNIMSVYAATAFVVLDGTFAGFLTSTATAFGGPLIEVGLLSLAKAGQMPGGYHYIDGGETGFFPLWIMPVYFLGGPAVGNLARGVWRHFRVEETKSLDKQPVGCKVCNDTRCVECPNCDGIGFYTAMGGRQVQCNCCKGRGYVICRSCFSSYGEDPNDIDAIREMMSKMPD